MKYHRFTKTSSQLLLQIYFVLFLRYIVGTPSLTGSSPPQSTTEVQCTHVPDRILRVPSNSKRESTAHTAGLWAARTSLCFGPLHTRTVLHRCHEEVTVAKLWIRRIVECNPTKVSLGFCNFFSFCLNAIVNSHILANYSPKLYPLSSEISLLYY